jgi:hypothetical protein
MHKAVVGVFANYSEASAVVRELENVGIMGEHVELINDADQDVVSERMSGSEAPKKADSPKKSVGKSSGDGKKAVEFDQLPSEVRDDPGTQPDYIGEQEFYATHVRGGKALVIVRPADEAGVEAATALLRDHGAKGFDGKKGPVVRDEEDRPRQIAQRA